MGYFSGKKRVFIFFDCGFGDELVVQLHRQPKGVWDVGG
jgi:hypothetical protein